MAWQKKMSVQERRSWRGRKVVGAREKVLQGLAELGVGLEVLGRSVQEEAVVENRCDGVEEEG